jgi:hypothetical protein
VVRAAVVLSSQEFPMADPFPVLTSVGYDGQTTISVAWSAGASPYYLIGLFQYGNLIKKSPLLTAKSGSLITDAPLTGTSFRVAVSGSDRGDDVHGWGGKLGVITAKVTGVTARYSGQSATADWTMEGTVPADAWLVAALFDADGKQAEQQVSGTTVSFPTPKPLRGDAYLQFQVKGGLTAGPLVTVPLAASVTPQASHVIYETDAGPRIEVTTTEAAPSGSVPAVTLLRQGVPVSTTHGQGTQVTVPLAEQLDPQADWAVTLAWVSGGVAGLQSEPLELITAPPAISDAQVHANQAITMNWEAQPGPPWVTAGWARLDALDSDDHRALSVTYPPTAFHPDPPLASGKLYELTVAAVRGPVRGPASGNLPLPSFVARPESTSYDGETVTVTWLPDNPLGTTGCLIEVLSAGQVIATGHGADGYGSVRADLNPVEAYTDQDPAASYTARLRWLCGPATGAPGPEKPVIATSAAVDAVYAKAGSIDVKIDAPGAPLPGDTSYVAYLMRGERTLARSTTVTRPPATASIAYDYGDLSGLTVRVRATSGSCSGPLGPPSPVLAAPVITHAALRGTTLDVTWTLPPDPAGAIASTKITLSPSVPSGPPEISFPRLAGTRATLKLPQALTGNWTVTAAVVGAGGPSPSMSAPSPGVQLLTAAPVITTAVFDGETVSARWSDPGAAPGTRYRLELFADRTPAGQAVVSGLAGRVTPDLPPGPDLPPDPAVPLRLAVSPLAPGAEYAADPGLTLIGTPPVLTKATCDNEGVSLAWKAPANPGSAITGYEAVFTAAGEESVVQIPLVLSRGVRFPDGLDALTPGQVAVRATYTAGGTTVTGPCCAPVHLLRDAPAVTEATVTADRQLRLSWRPALGGPEGYEATLTTDDNPANWSFAGTTGMLTLANAEHRSATLELRARRGVAASPSASPELILQAPRLTAVDWDGSALTATWDPPDTPTGVHGYELTVRRGDVVVATTRTGGADATATITLPREAAGLAVTVAALALGSRGPECPPVALPAPGPALTSVTIRPDTGKATVTWPPTNPAPTAGYLLQPYRDGLSAGEAVAVTATSFELADAPAPYEDLEVAVAVKTTVSTTGGTTTTTGPFGPRLRVLTGRADIRDVDFDGRTVAVSWAPVPGATGYALTAAAGDGGHAGESLAAGGETAKRFTVAPAAPGFGAGYTVTVQPLRGASSGVRSTAPLARDDLYVLPAPARIVRASTAQVTPQPALAYLPDLTATGQPLTGLPIAPPQAGETLPPFTLEQAPSTAAPMKYRLRIENGALAFGATRGALAAAYRKLLSTAEANGAAPRGILALQQAVARLMPQTLGETLYYSYGLSSAGSVDLRPGMVLRVAFSSFDLTAVGGAPPWSSGYAGGTVLDYEIGDYAGADGSWVVGFDAFIDWLVTQGALTVPAPQTPSAGGTTQSGGADAADLSYPLFSQPFYRLLVPSTLQDPAKPANSATNQQFTIAAAAKWQEIDAATAAPGGGVHVAYFRGRAVLRACIRVEVDGAEHVVPVGTTVGNLLDRVARRPPWASLALRGVRLYRAPGSAVLPGPAVLDPAQGYDAAALSRVRLDWPAATAWPAGPQDALSLPLLHGDRVVFGKDT